MKVRLSDDKIRFRTDAADVAALLRDRRVYVTVGDWSLSLAIGKIWRVDSHADGIDVTGDASLPRWASGDDVALSVDVGGVRVLVERDLKP